VAAKAKAGAEGAGGAVDAVAGSKKASGDGEEGSKTKVF
jgi:hypothetical protein